MNQNPYNAERIMTPDEQLKRRGRRPRLLVNSLTAHFSRKYVGWLGPEETQQEKLARETPVEPGKVLHFPSHNISN